MAFQGRRYLGVENRIQNFEDNRSEINQPIITRYVHTYMLFLFLGAKNLFKVDMLNTHLIGSMCTGYSQ